MTRATNAPQSRRRRKEILKAAKGYRGGRGTQLRTASMAVMKSRQYAYRDRKRRKGEFRRLWITRINKILADMAVSDPEVFSEVARLAGGSPAGSDIALQ